MKSVAGRPLRPGVCSCSRGCRSRAEMRQQHGDPDKFLDSLTRAFHAGDISFNEAERANLRYREEYRDAPEHTQVDKS